MKENCINLYIFDMIEAVNGKSSFYEAEREGLSSAESNPELVEMKCLREPVLQKGSDPSSEARLAYVTCIEWRATFIRVEPRKIFRLLFRGDFFYFTGEN